MVDCDEGDDTLFVHVFKLAQNPPECAGLLFVCMLHEPTVPMPCCLCAVVGFRFLIDCMKMNDTCCLATKP